MLIDKNDQKMTNEISRSYKQKEWNRKTCVLWGKLKGEEGMGQTKSIVHG